MRKTITLFIITALVIGCRKKDTASKSMGVMSQKAMVVSAREEASKVGTEIIAKGGNAYDAAIGVTFALAVTYPFAGNIGGGGFMVYRNADGSVGSIDYREKAPMAATKDMYLDEDGNPDLDKSQLGILASGVPGTVDAMLQIYEKFGTLPFQDLVQPAIDLAKNGYVLTEGDAAKFNEKKDLFIQANIDSTNIPFVKLDGPWKAGDTLKQPELAETLMRIQKEKRDGFYKGKTAELMVAEMENQNGIITQEDLNNYHSEWRDPVQFTFKDLNIISMGPPSSGGVCIGEILKSVEPFDIGQYPHNSVKYIQLLTEAERRAYADRSYWLGDPDFVKIPLDTLLSAKYNDRRMADFNWNRATPSSEVTHGNVMGYESNETTHFSIVDDKGNAVSITTTINGAFGCKTVVSGAGFLLNNEMDDFSVKPGVPNMFGLIGAEANAIAPQKRMLSSMTPTIVTKNNDLYMVVGTPGGSTIITSVLQTILNVYEYNMSMQEAVDAPRFHHQWLPDEVVFEPNGFSQETLNKLKELGYNFKEGESTIIGKVDAILVHKNGFYEGGADKRGDDTASGL